MSVDLSQLTIAGLFKELSEVERAIRTCDPTLTCDGAHTRVNAQLIDLAAQEQQICDELARRRSALREQLRARQAAVGTAGTAAL